MEQKNCQNPLLAGVIGNPIYHSQSPRLHNYWLKKNNINGYYIPIKVETQNLEKSIQALISLGFRGINVTIPHKTTVLTYADIITDRASIIGAANTLYFNVDGKITADNTDGYGFSQNIYEECPSWMPGAGPAVVLGAGGAAKAIIYTLLAEGVPKVKISNRTKTKAKVIAENFGNKVEVIDWYSTEASLKEANIVINTTSLGMIGQPRLKLNLSDINPNALVTDLVYNPRETEILKNAKALGCKTVGGLGMLLYQAELGFRNWFNIKPTVDSELKKYMENTNYFK